VQVRRDDLDQRAAAGRRRFDFDECHDQGSVAKLISWPGFRLTYAFFQPRRRPMNRPKRFSLPLTIEMWTVYTSHFHMSSTAAFTSGLVASGATRKITCECLSAMYVAF